MNVTVQKKKPISFRIKFDSIFRNLSYLTKKHLQEIYNWINQLIEIFTAFGH